MSPLNLRHSVRAVILADDHRVLLCRHLLTDPPGAVWAAPGGGVEPGESPSAALRRELREEVGLTVEGNPPHVWHRRVVNPAYIPGYDGVVNDYYLVRVSAFTPRGVLSDEELAAENITGIRWWSLPEIAGYRGPDLFGPRDLRTPLAALIAGEVPAAPITLGA